MKTLLSSYFQRIPQESRVAIAVSGGIDSVFLLREVVAHCLQFHRSRQIFVLHLNHNTRGKENDREQKFVQDLCASLGVPCISEKLEKDAKASQEKLRKKRKEFFQRHLGPKDFLFLAHNEDDQAETIFFRLLRGVGLRGLKGMKDFDPPIVRPLLSVSRAQIFARSKKLGYQWVEDTSNASTKYERNWIRLEVFPLLEKRKPGIKQKLAALAKEAADLPQSKLPSPIFRSEEGWSLFSLDSKEWQNTEILSRLFFLDRKMATRMKDQIQKGSGKINYRNEVYWISHGLLLKNAEKWQSGKEKKDGYESAFGAWFPSKGLVTRKSLLGEKAKKIFQEKGVPVFFRDSFPFREVQGKWKLQGIPDQPTALGKWFIDSFELRRNHDDSVSKEKNQRPLPRRSPQL